LVLLNPTSTLTAHSLEIFKLIPACILIELQETQPCATLSLSYFGLQNLSCG